MAVGLRKVAPERTGLTIDMLRQQAEVIAAFDQPDNAGKGVITMEGQMVELLHRDIARRTVAIADAIAGGAG